MGREKGRGDVHLLTVTVGKNEINFKSKAIIGVQQFLLKEYLAEAFFSYVQI